LALSESGLEPRTSSDPCHADDLECAEVGEGRLDEAVRAEQRRAGGGSWGSNTATNQERRSGPEGASGW